jgi:hypothetical protein
VGPSPFDRLLMLMRWTISSTMTVSSASRDVKIQRAIKMRIYIWHFEPLIE